MKNIYEIISEQKKTIDLNLARYDLEYTVSQFENNDYYLQEGLGESVQNAGRKVIEFIKSIIKKIKELISKFIDLIFGKKNRTGEINKEIQKINDAKEQQPSGGGGGGGSNDVANKSNDGANISDDRVDSHNTNNEKENFKSTTSDNNTQVKKCKDVNELLSESKLLIQFEYFGDIEKIITICNDFFDNIGKTVNDMKSARFYDGKTAINTIIKRTFRKNAKDGGLVNDDRYSMEELEREFKLHTGETSKTVVTVSVSSVSKILLSYLERADDFAKYLRNKEKALVNDLEKLIKMLEDMSKERLADPNNEISSTNDKINTARDLSTLIANFVNIACRITAQRLNYTMQVVEKVKAEYAKN